MLYITVLRPLKLYNWPQPPSHPTNQIRRHMRYRSRHNSNVTGDWLQVNKNTYSRRVTTERKTRDQFTTHTRSKVYI